MKTAENKGFGLIGIKVELSWIEVMAISELANELKSDQPYGRVVMSPVVEKAINFLSRLAMKQIGEDIKKAEDELFSSPAEPMLPVSCDDEEVRPVE